MLRQLSMSSKRISSEMNIGLMAKVDICHQVPPVVQYKLSRLYREPLDQLNEERVKWKYESSFCVTNYHSNLSNPKIRHVFFPIIGLIMVNTEYPIFSSQFIHSILGQSTFMTKHSTLITLHITLLIILYLFIIIIIVSISIPSSLLFNIFVNLIFNLLNLIYIQVFSPNILYD